MDIQPDTSLDCDELTTRNKEWVMVGNPFIDQHLESIRALAREYGVARLEVFGSAATAAFDASRSDVDFLVAYPPGYDYGPWLSRLQALEAALATLLDRDVDLVTTSALRNARFRREAEKTRMVIYDASKIAELA